MGVGETVETRRAHAVSINGVFDGPRRCPGSAHPECAHQPQCQGPAKATLQLHRALWWLDCRPQLLHRLDLLRVGQPCLHLLQGGLDATGRNAPICEGPDVLRSDATIAVCVQLLVGELGEGALHSG